MFELYRKTTTAAVAKEFARAMWKAGVRGNDDEGTVFVQQWKTAKDGTEIVRFAISSTPEIISIARRVGANY